MGKLGEAVGQPGTGSLAPKKTVQIRQFLCRLLMPFVVAGNTNATALMMGVIISWDLRARGISAKEKEAAAGGAPASEHS